MVVVATGVTVRTVMIVRGTVTGRGTVMVRALVVGSMPVPAVASLSLPRHTGSMYACA